MNTLPPRVLLHPTTLNHADLRVGACATALAMHAGASLTTLHACAEGDPSALPPASDWLTRWGKPADAIKHARLVEYCCDDVTETLLHRAHALRPDLIVMGTHHQSRWQHMLRGSVAQQLVADMHTPTLILPLDHAELLNEDTGALDLRTIVVAAADLDTLRRAGPWAAWLASISANQHGVLRALHIGHDAPAPDGCLTPEGWRWELEQLPPSKASLEEDIVHAVHAAGPGTLLIMATHGEDSLRDLLLGSHTERVLAQLDRPMLVLPY
jgi:nucleotide-binding universal stress UspA family protein